MQIFYKINRSQDIQLSLIFWFQKAVLHQKLLIKLDRRKIRKMLQTVLETIVSQIILQNFCKIGLNPDELELLECALVITFLNENR